MYQRVGKYGYKNILQERKLCLQVGLLRSDDISNVERCQQNLHSIQSRLDKCGNGNVIYEVPGLFETVALLCRWLDIAIATRHPRLLAFMATWVVCCCQHGYDWKRCYGFVGPITYRPCLLTFGVRNASIYRAKDRGVVVHRSSCSHNGSSVAQNGIEQRRYKDENCSKINAS
ncbi:hypothetical protein BGW36DRAFT_371151 [Talaromyces proteolyticus]|uniref:Uncharacterized protein n=1 Tax=Talaromyces proteolyticus TaxID=1131652 RepID=A0AAD4Q3B9_9EURO|nr:uncharacterized protein BGW36DRAFT_371151 [Talaromyces proteolyticus]KAH8701588.1 hypothetical protein BGW36DRAFT_371151 [Talaromyces proteolyticus]